MPHWASPPGGAATGFAPTDKLLLDQAGASRTGQLGQVIALERVPLRRFGVVGDASQTDGNRLKTAIETAADQHLDLLVHPSPQAEGWYLYEKPAITGKSHWRMTGLPGAAISRRGDNNGFGDWTDCHHVAVDGVNLDARTSEAALELRGCTGIFFRNMNTKSGRLFRLYDGTTDVHFKNVTFDAPTCAVEFGEGDSGMIEGHATVGDVTLEDVKVMGSVAEPFEWRNSVRGLHFKRVRCLDCNTGQNEEGGADLGGPCEDVTFEDFEIDTTGTRSPYVSTAFTGLRIKRANGINPKNIRVIRPTIRMNSAHAESAGIVFDEVDGWWLEGGLIEGDLKRSVQVGGAGGFGYVGGTRMVGAREASLRAVGAASVTGFARVFLAPAAGGVPTMTGGSAVIDLAA
jgi:hypothetical protein